MSDFTPIIGLIGAKRSGKDTAAQRLVEGYGFERVAFADALKGAAYEMNPLIADGGLRLAELVDSVGWEVAKSKPEVRRFLQELGVSMRKHTHKDIWVSVVRDRLVAARYSRRRIVVTDVRFPNETAIVNEFGGAIIKIERPSLQRDDADKHISERALDDYIPDIVVVNDSTIEALHLAIDEALPKTAAASWYDERPLRFPASDYAVTA